MQDTFNFEGVRNADLRDVLHFHMYDYKPNADDDAMTLTLNAMKSASLEIVESIMGQNIATDKALEEINSVIMSRLKPKYLFSPLVSCAGNK